MTALMPRVGDEITVSLGTVRTVEALWPDGHYRITLDVADLDVLAKVQP